MVVCLVCARYNAHPPLQPITLGDEDYDRFVSILEALDVEGAGQALTGVNQPPVEGEPSKVTRRVVTHEDFRALLSLPYSDISICLERLVVDDVAQLIHVNRGDVTGPLMAENGVPPDLRMTTHVSPIWLFVCLSCLNEGCYILCSIAIFSKCLCHAQEYIHSMKTFLEFHRKRRTMDFWLWVLQQQLDVDQISRDTFVQKLKTKGQVRSACA